MDPIPATNPRFDRRWVRDLCELGPRPLITTGWLRLWMTHHFQKGNFESTAPSIQKAFWSSDRARTGIAIESVTKWIPELTEHRPGVIIKRNAWKRVRLGIADKLMFHWPIDGQDSYTNFWQGSHTLFCISGEGAEAEILAAEVYRELNQFSDVIRRTLNLVRFEVMEVGELMLLEQARENFVVPVTVGYAYQENWRVLQEAPRIRRIDLRDLMP